MRHTASTTDPIAYLRDALQARVLARLFTQATHGIVLKGGLAMRVLHDHARATKDIDLDADHRLPLASIQAVMRRAITQAGAGLLSDITITEPKQTDTTLRWKVCGHDPISHQALHMTVEVSHRRDIQPEEIQNAVAQNTVMFPQPIRVYTSEVLALNKVQALLSPTRDAPRDVLDLYLLITASVKPPVRALRDWARLQGPQLIKQMWDKIETMTEARFQSEVLPSLGVCARSAEFSDWDAVRMQVGEHVEAWLTWAQAPETETSKTETSAPTLRQGGHPCPP